MEINGLFTWKSRKRKTALIYSYNDKCELVLTVGV